MAPPFRKGQIVICTDAFFADTHGEILPEAGMNYTIRDIVNRPGNEVCLRFNEIINNPLKYDDGLQECSFNSSRFRPRKGKN